MEKHWMVYWTLSAIAGFFLLFAVSEFMQPADGQGFKAAANKMIFELNVGETQMLFWPVTNMEEEEIIEVEFYATGEGSELFVFEKYVKIKPMTRQEFEIFVTVPDDHPDNVEYHPLLFVLKRAPPLEEGVTGMTISLQYKIKPIIKIGDNPIFTPPVVEEKPEAPEPRISNVPIEIVETVVEETLEEKMERIKTANQESIKETPITAPKPIPQKETTISESETDPEPTYEITATDPPKKDCDFWCWLFSIFGF